MLQNTPSYLKYFVVPEDKVGNYIVFVNKPHYILVDCLIKELGNPTYTGRHFR